MHLLLERISKIIIRDIPIRVIFIPMDPLCRIDFFMPINILIYWIL